MECSTDDDGVLTDDPYINRRHEMIGSFECDYCDDKLAVVNTKHMWLFPVANAYRKLNPTTKDTVVSHGSHSMVVQGMPRHVVLQRYHSHPTLTTQRTSATVVLTDRSDIDILFPCVRRECARLSLARHRARSVKCAEGRTVL